MSGKLPFIIKPSTISSRHKRRMLYSLNTFETNSFIVFLEPMYPEDEIQVVFSNVKRPSECENSISLIHAKLIDCLFINTLMPELRSGCLFNGNAHDIYMLDLFQHLLNQEIELLTLQHNET